MNETTKHSFRENIISQVNYKQIAYTRELIYEEANRAVSLFRCQRRFYENVFLAKRHKSLRNYPFTEPAVTPLMMDLLRNIYTTITGIRYRQTQYASPIVGYNQLYPLVT